MTRNPSRLAVTLAVLQALTALSAFAGGAGWIAAPDGDIMGMSMDRLEGSPFNDFLVPGLVLFFGVGGSMFLGGLMVWRRWKWAYEASFAAGAIMFGWITIQVLIINEVNILHIVYWVVGMVVMLVAAWLWWQERRGAGSKAHTPQPGPGRGMRPARR